MAKQVIKKIPIYDLVEDGYVEFGNYVNQKRHMTHVLDGCKPSYRRMVWTGLEMPDKNVKVATLAGMCGGKYSPHNSETLPAVVSEMVSAGIFTGQGAHGSKSIYKGWNIGPAAGRYIEARVNKDWRDMMSPLISLVPKVQSDLGYMEPEYLPTPIPMSLLHGSLGLGIGIKSVVPNFSAKSLIKAMENDDPNLLESNGDLVINKKRSELLKLWTTGEGRVCYMFYIEENAKLEGRDGFIMYGDPRFIQSNLTANLEGKIDGSPEEWGWIGKGLVEMIDISSAKTGKRIFFTVKSNQRSKDKITLEMLRAELEIMRFNQDSYKLAVTDGNCSSVISLKDWVTGCYNNYARLVTEYKTKHIDKLVMRVNVANNAKDIVDLIRKNDSITKEEIAKKLNIDLEIVSEATKKSISVLMKFNREAELVAIEEEKVKITNLKPEDFYENILK